MSQRFDGGDLESAREAGVIDDATAKKLGDFMRGAGDPGASYDNENLRFLANFNDIFLSIGLLILTLGISLASGLLFGGTGNALFVAGPVVIALWAMMEYFAARRRLLLPSMTLATLIVWISSLLFALMASGISDVSEPDINLIEDGLSAIENFALFAATGGLLAAIAVFVRFRLPFCFFLMATNAALLVFLGFARMGGDIGTGIGAVVILMTGFVTLAFACWFDMRDPARTSRTSDIGFWLNFAAAPQIILGLGFLLETLDMPLREMPGAVIFIAALVPLALLSLALNRRALIAASLISFWIAVTAIVGDTGGDDPITGFVLALLLTGGGVVLISSGWKTARRMVLSVLPQGGSAQRLFPPEPA